MLTSFGYCQDQSLQLTIKSNKELYRVGDTIEFILSLKNISKEDFYGYMDDYYNAGLFDITNSEGVVQEFERTVEYDVEWSKGDYKLIKPGRDYFWTVRAKIIKDKGLTLDFNDSIIKLTGKGEFKISAKYQGWDGFTTDESGREMRISKKFGWKNVFTGLLISNAITIKIE